MGKRKYNNSEEAYKAKLANIQRYNAEKYKRVYADLPAEYTEKIEYITQKMNISRAQFLKNCIDTAYNELRENE